MAVNSRFFRSFSSIAAYCALGCVLVGATPVRAQESGPVPTNLIAARDDTSQKRFFWCAGVTEPEDLKAYVAAGFDTLVIPIPWSAGEDGALLDNSYDPQRALAKEGARYGLQIIFSLPAAPEGLGVSHINADSPSYTALWTNWAQSAVESLNDAPNLTAWMLPDDSRGLITFEDDGFSSYLSTQFASIESLNAHWGTAYNRFSSISMLDVETLVNTWKAKNASSSGSSLVENGIGNTPPDPNAAFPPAALSLADYKANAWKELMAMWASTLRGADSKRPIFSGVCPDYAQLLAMPEGVDFSVEGIGPNVAEPDFATSNPQAVDIARRGGSKSAIARFAITPTVELDAPSTAALIPRWSEAALSRGARGIAFDSFEAIKRNPVLNDAVTKTLSRLKAEPLDVDAPIATTAVLLDPLAEGATLQLGQNNEARGLYGFGDGLVQGEPSNLVSSLRWGTAFGGVDYLSPEDLSTVDLSRYSTIMAPQLLDCSPATADKLAVWMRAGGTLMADLGLGALQNGGSANTLPPQMALLAGGVGPYDLRSLPFNVRVASSHPLLPTWSKSFETRPGMLFSSGDGAESAFNGAVGFAPVPAKTVRIGTGPSTSTLVIPSADTPQVALTVASVEQGYFVFAPFRLWASWRPGQLGFDALHGDILARGTQIAVASDSLTPFPAGTKLGLTRFPEVVNRARFISFLNHDVAGQAKNIAVDTLSAGDWLWSNAYVRLLPSSSTLSNSARLAPIDNPDELQSRPRAVSLYTTSAPSQKLVCRMRPIALQNLNGGTATANIAVERTSLLAVKVWGPTLAVNVTTDGGGWQPIAPDGTTNFRLTVYDSPDGYRCPPGSRHRVSIADFGTPAEGDKVARKKNTVTTQTVVADARGSLKIEFVGTGSDVKIEPDNTPVGKNKDRRPR